MNISKAKAISLLCAVCVASSVLTHFCNPTIRALNNHGIGVREFPTKNGTSLIILVKATQSAVTLDFHGPANIPSEYNVLNLDTQSVTVYDKQHRGKFDSLSLIRKRDGIDYLFEDPSFSGEFTRLGESKGNEFLGNMLSIRGEWLPAKHSGKNGIVMLDGKETLVDPSKTPIAILGPAPTSPVADAGKAK